MVLITGNTGRKC